MTVDRWGWASVEQIARKLSCRDQFADLLEQDIQELASGRDVKRFELDGALIRARYGHTIRVTLGYASMFPPKYLFHGTSLTALSRIPSMGLLPMGRQFVHLASDPEYSEIVGAKNGSSRVLLRVDAEGAARELDVRFYPATDVVWLSEPVPPQFIGLVLGKENQGEAAAQLSLEKDDERALSMQLAIAGMFSRNDTV